MFPELDEELVRRKITPEVYDFNGGRIYMIADELELLEEHCSRGEN